MSVAKRHHTVPQFYLRGFADGERISTVRLPGTARFTQSVRKAASETNFYSIPEHKDEPDIFEKMFAKLEGEAASIFTKIQTGTWPLEAGDRWELAQFLVLQAARGPEQRRNLQHLAAQTVRLEIGFGGKEGVKAWAQRRRGLSVSDEEAEQIWKMATQPDGPPVVIRPIAHIKQIGKLTRSLLPYVAGRPWTLLRFERRRLITCDSPISLVPHADGELWEGVGFMTAWGIAYPLTRRIGLLLGDPMVFADSLPVEVVQSGELDRCEAGTTLYERFFNRVTVQSASEWLYHHPDDEEFVPDDLPDPEPLSMRMQGAPVAFSGEPLYRGKA